MRIRFKTGAKHEGRPYEADDEVTVSEALGTYFCHCGWAVRLDGKTPPPAPQPKDVTLDIHGGVLGHTASNVGG